MVRFCVARAEGGRGAFRFGVCGNTALLAGSRGHQIDERTCRDILGDLARLGLGFYVGCGGGVDESFRRALSHSPWRRDAWIACTSRRRAWAARSLGLDAFVVVPRGLAPEVARYRCTLWMVRRCALAILFPDCRHDGEWGSGSRLVFRSALANLKPLFIVSDRCPAVPAAYHVLPADLFAAVRGFWVVADPYGDGGTCDDGH
jgi:hypothetical protein